MRNWMRFLGMIVPVAVAFFALKALMGWIQSKPSEPAVATSYVSPVHTDIRTYLRQCEARERARLNEMRALERRIEKIRLANEESRIDIANQIIGHANPGVGHAVVLTANE